MSLEEIDLIDGRNFVAGVPYQWFAELRREAPVYWHPEEVAPRGGFWAVTRYDDCVTSTGTGSTSPRPAAARSSTRWTTTSWPSSS